MVTGDSQASFCSTAGSRTRLAVSFGAKAMLGDIENRAASSSAHIYGKTKVSAESFTCAGLDRYARYTGSY
jgi:hypothetical protein